MSNENKVNGNDDGKNGSKSGVSNGNTGVVTGPVEPVSVRLPGHYVMMTVDGPDKKTGDFKEGGIGVKTGDKWTWFTYTDIKKLIDACTVTKLQFNGQLEKERKRAGVVDL